MLPTFLLKHFRSLESAEPPGRIAPTVTDVSVTSLLNGRLRRGRCVLALDVGKRVLLRLVAWMLLQRSKWI